MKYEVTYKGGRKEILEKAELPKFSPNFNAMVKRLKVGQNMYEITDMVDNKRVE